VWGSNSTTAHDMGGGGGGSASNAVMGVVVGSSTGRRRARGPGPMNSILSKFIQNFQLPRI
jgi:hypothetical protein